METTSTKVHTPIETFKVIKSKTPDGFTVINNNYKIIRRLAEGSLSVVKLIQSTVDGKFYALKQYNKTILKKKKELIRGKDGKVEYKDSLGDILNEIKIMKRLNHPNVIKLLEIINDPEYHKIYLIMDYCEKGSVIDWNEDEFEFRSKTKEKYIPEEEMARIMAHVIRGLEYLHNNKIVHRDLKPQNLLQSADGTVKIADFDIAAEIYEGVVLNKTKGTLHFMAPELCKKTSTIGDDMMGYTADLWCIGMTLYCMTYMKLPFLERSLIDLIAAIENKPHFHLKSREASEELKDLIDRLMEKDPVKRITLQGMKEHIFFEKCGQKLL